MTIFYILIQEQQNRLLYFNLNKIQYTTIISIHVGNSSLTIKNKHVIQILAQILIFMVQYRSWILQNLNMNQHQQNNAKKEEEQAYLKMCEKCTKFFTNQQAYQTHLKMKHEHAEEKQASYEEGSQEQSDQEEERGESKNNSKKAAKNVPIRSRMMEIQRNQLQDNIYTFLGQLGEKNVEPATNRADIINFANQQKLTGQTNYSVNKVIRTPYEQPIKCSEEAPLTQIQKSKYKDFLLKLKKQLQVLEAKVQQEKQIWQLRDPMAPEEEVMDEFSLMDIKKLIQNYPKRKIEISHPHFSIFLLWIGRICKAPAFKEFYMILGCYIAQLYSKQENISKGQQAYECWKKFHKSFQGKKIDEEQLQNLKIFDEKGSKKFIQYYVNWVDIFRALNI